MEINVLIEEELEAGVDVGWLQSVAERALFVLDVTSNVELGLFVASDEKVRQLNRNYLGKDEPTDVIAFSMLPTEETPDLPRFILPPDGVMHLGEVIISYPQAVRQAEEHNHSVEKEITILIIHGVLHLLGYEDEKPELKQRMAAREKEVLSYFEEVQS